MDAGDRPARLAVGVLGAGRVGSALGAALAQAGHRVVAASGVSDASQRRAAERLGRRSRPAPRRSWRGRRARPADRARRRAARAGRRASPRPAPCAPGKLLVHTSGRVRRWRCWTRPLRAGALPLALHPVMTFTGTPVDDSAPRRLLLRRHRARRAAARPPRPWSSRWAASPTGSRRTTAPLYHAALAGGANHLVTLVAESMELLRAVGVEPPGRMLGPLLGAALDNALRLGDAGADRPGRAR